MVLCLIDEAKLQQMMIVMFEVDAFPFFRSQRSEYWMCTHRIRLRFPELDETIEFFPKCRFCLCDIHVPQWEGRVGELWISELLWLGFVVVQPGFHRFA